MQAFVEWIMGGLNAMLNLVWISGGSSGEGEERFASRLLITCEKESGWLSRFALGEDEVGGAVKERNWRWLENAPLRGELVTDGRTPKRYWGGRLRECCLERRLPKATIDLCWRAEERVER